MDKWFALAELLLVFGVVMGFGWHQLRDLRKYRDEEADSERSDSRERPD